MIRGWKGRSLRSWIAVGMTIEILPLAASAVAGYLLLGRGVTVSLQDIAARQREQIDPTQRLRLLIVEAGTPLDGFVAEGEPREVATYRALREQIEVLFATVHEHVGQEPELRTLVERAREDWTAADRLAAEALSVRRRPGDPRGAELIDRFQGLAGSAVDKLGALYDDLATDLKNDHDVALRDMERADWLAAAAAVVSALAVLVGVILIGRIIAGSVERLVSGAEFFASGDRDHRIDVQVPPELRRVAIEFNRMIERIHASETALADLARRDGLTLLLNRRAFDEELAGMFARQHRFGERFALAVFDLDHFKQINDRHGHGTGDEVLRTASRALAGQLRPFDRLFRIGGEEFAAILPGTDGATAALAAERLRQAIAAQTIPLGDSAIGVTVSVGVASAWSGAEPDTLLKAADTALYRAKAAGRNQVMVSGEP
jgi:diguanylate cyclase (GGDEF)-like protein